MTDWWAPANDMSQPSPGPPGCHTGPGLLNASVHLAGLLCSSLPHQYPILLSELAGHSLPLWGSVGGGQWRRGKGK